MRTEDEYLALLAAADDPVRGERPVGFDRAVAEARLARLAEALDAALGGGCVLCGDVQDASFLGDVVLPRAFFGPDGDPMMVRVSNFGDFATITCASVEAPAPLVATVGPVLASLGYRFVPDDVLARPYTGAFPLSDRPRHPSWWFRFFDYL